MGKNKSLYYKLGLNIRGLRKAYGETQLELAMAIDVDSDKTISHYELGERIPERDILLKIAKHYRITENELLNGDFSQMKSLGNTPVNDRKYIQIVLEKMLPLISTDTAMENIDFKKAFEIHKNLYTNMINGTVLEESKINRCMQLYEKARRNGIIEGAANYIWWLIFYGILINFLNPQCINYLEANRDNKISTKELIKNIYLISFDGEESYKENRELEKEKIEYRKQYEKNFFLNVYLLKHSSEYSDLGDYYLALGYRWGIISNSLSPEMNTAIGDELMLTFNVLGNQYAEKLIDLPKKFS